MINHSKIILVAGQDYCISPIGDSVSGTDGGASIDLGPLSLTKLVAIVDTNTLDEDSVIHLEVDDVSKLSFTVPAGQSGRFEASGTVTVADGEKVCYDAKLTDSTTGQIRIEHLFAI